MVNSELEQNPSNRPWRKEACKTERNKWSHTACELVDFTSLRVVVSCVGGFSEENTLVSWPCVAVLVSIVSQINTNSITYP